MAKASTARKAKYKDAYFSFSKIQDFLLCPKRYKLKFVDKVSEPSNQFKDYGLKIHNVNDMAIKAGGTDSPEVAAKIFSENGLNEADIQHGLARMEYLSKYHDILAEFRFELTLSRGKHIEFHIDAIYWDDFGTCYIQDLKTSPMPLSNEELETDLQLDIYAWAFVEYLKQNQPVYEAKLKEIRAAITDMEKEKEATKEHSEDRLKVLPDIAALDKEYRRYERHLQTARGGKVMKGIWLWRYNYKVEIEHHGQDISNQLEYTIETIKKAKEYTPKANRFCADCHYFRTCYPVPIDKTYKELKALENHYKALAEDKKTELVRDAYELGTNTITDKDTVVFIKETIKKEYNTKAALDAAEAAGFEDPLIFVKANNTEINKELKKKSTLLKLEPETVSTTLRVMPKDKLKEGE